MSKYICFSKCKHTIGNMLKMMNCTTNLQLSPIQPCNLAQASLVAIHLVLETTYTQSYNRVSAKTLGPLCKGFDLCCANFWFIAKLFSKAFNLWYTIQSNWCENKVFNLWCNTFCNARCLLQNHCLKCSIFSDSHSVCYAKYQLFSTHCAEVFQS